MQPAKKIVLHSKKLSILSLKINNCTTPWSLVPEKEFLEIFPAVRIPTGKHVIEITYTGTNDGTSFTGFFKSKTDCKNADGTDQFAMVTQFGNALINYPYYTDFII